MHGNIWEWCQDEYDASYYRTSPAEDPPGKTIDGPLWLFKDLVVRRGGGWDSPSSLCRSARREASVRIDRYNFTGFRVALDVAEKAEPPKEGK
jgi:formylglycine-generating enzyme required for sulfatase activity